MFCCVRGEFWSQHFSSKHSALTCHLLVTHLEYIMHKADYVMSVCFVLFFSLAQKEKSIKNNKNKIVKRRPKTSVSHSAPLCCKHSQIFYFILLFFCCSCFSTGWDRRRLPYRGETSESEALDEKLSACKGKKDRRKWKVADRKRVWAEEPLSPLTEWPFVMTEVKERGSLRVDGMPVSVTCTCVTLWRDSLSLRAEVLLIRLAARTGLYSAGGGRTLPRTLILMRCLGCDTMLQRYKDMLSVAMYIMSPCPLRKTCHHLFYLMGQ